MENKINIAELLKDCPSGMELDCTMYDSVHLGSIIEGHIYPIEIQTPVGVIFLSKYGCCSLDSHCKCIIFPKGKTTWEGFHRPFKDGDILATDLGSVFYLNTHLNTDESYGCYVGIGADGSFHICEPFAYKKCCGLATEKEKQKLFEAIKDNGYKWNEETKTLEKLIAPWFKVGDRIRNNISTRNEIIESIEWDRYILACGQCVKFTDQDEWELVPNKFDITTLKPFDKVLVRDDNKNKWSNSFYGFYDINYDINYPYECCGNSFAQCIPYEGNEHLLGTSDDCDNFYKTWE